MDGANMNGQEALEAVTQGLAIMYLVLSFVLVGNALRDALDVRH